MKRAGLTRGWLRRGWPLIVLVAAAAAVSSAYILVNETVGPVTDTESHACLAQSFASAISHHGLTGLWLSLRSVPSHWMPLPYLIYGLPAALLGATRQQLELYGVALLPLLAWAVYRIGALTDGRRSGLIAAALAVCSPGVLGQTRHLTVDLPGVVATSLAFLAFVRSGELRTPRGILLFGAACGCALLTRAQALFFLIGPALVGATGLLIRQTSRGARVRAVAWLGAGLAVAAIPALLHLAGRWEVVVQQMATHTDPSHVQTIDGPPGLLHGLWVHRLGLSHIAGWPILLAAGWGVVALVRERAHRTWLPLAAWVLSGLVLMALTISRDTRYMLPAAPPLALLAACGLQRLRRPVLSACVLLLTAGPAMLSGAWDLQRCLPSSLTSPTYTWEPRRAPDRPAAVTIARMVEAGGSDGADGSGAFLLIHAEDELDLRTLVQVVPRVQIPWCVRGLSPLRYCGFAIQRSRRILLLTRGRRDLPLVASERVELQRGPALVGLYDVPPQRLRAELVW